MGNVLRHDIPGVGSFCVALAAWRFGRSIPAELRAYIGQLLLMAPVLLLVFLWQQKGFVYHLIPFDVASTIAAGVAAYGILCAPVTGPIRIAVCAGCVGGIMAVSAAAAAAVHAAPEDFADDPVVRAIAEHDRGGGVLFLATGPAPALQASILFGTSWSQRASSIWLLPGIEDEMARAGLHFSDLATASSATPVIADAVRYRRSIIEDLNRYRPDVVLVLRGGGENAARELSVLDFLSTDPDFAQAWRDIAAAGPITSLGCNFDLYVRR